MNNKVKKYETDVLILGAGAAGLRAAIAAKREGINVLVATKNQLFSDSSQFNNKVPWGTSTVAGGGCKRPSLKKIVLKFICGILLKVADLLTTDNLSRFWLRKLLSE